LPGERGVAQRERVVHVQRAGDAQRDRLARVRAQLPRGGRPVAGAARYEREAVVRFQISRMLRATAPREVVGARAERARVVAELLCDCALGRARRHANRDVEALVDEIDHAIDQQNLHFHLGDRAAKSEDGGQHAHVAEHDWPRHAEDAARDVVALFHHRFERVEIAEDATRSFEVDRAEIRELHLARRAVEEAHLETFFEARDELAHAGRRQTELRRAAGERSRLRRRDERRPAVSLSRSSVIRDAWSHELGRASNCLRRRDRASSMWGCSLACSS
jgi:hypothetical protein